MCVNVCVCVCVCVCECTEKRSSFSKIKNQESDHKEVTSHTLVIPTFNTAEVRVIDSISAPRALFCRHHNKQAPIVLLSLPIKLRKPMVVSIKTFQILADSSLELAEKMRK